VTSKNDITGDEIKSKGFSSDYEDNWTLIFERCAECNVQTKGQGIDVKSIETNKTMKLCQACYNILTGPTTQVEKQDSMTDLNWDGK
jgi:hypothetical protein